MNLDQLDTMLKESPSPAMKLDPDQVLRGGRGRQQRRRTAIGGGVLAGALLVGGAGFAALRHGTGTPMPGGTTRTTSAIVSDRAAAPLSSHYDMTDGSKKPGRIRFNTPSVDGAREPVEITLQVKKTVSGLKLAQVKKSAAGSTTANLPIVQSLPGGLVITRVGNSTLAAMPTPGDITGATLTDDGTLKKQNATSNDGLVLTDGTPVTVFLTAQPISVTGAYWLRGGRIETNDGRTVTPTRINSQYSAFVLPAQKIRGVLGSSGAIGTQPIGTSTGLLGFGDQGKPMFWGRWFTSKPENVRFTWTGLSGRSPVVSVAQVTGTRWWIAAAQTDTDLAKARVTSVTWTDASGPHTESNP